MKPREQELENLLRRAPKPAPPPGLKQQLGGQVRLPLSEELPRTSMANPVPGGWWRRWWPALAPAAISVACVGVLTVRQAEIRNIEGTIRNLSSATRSEISPSSATTAPEQPAPTGVEVVGAEQEEISRLRERVTALTAEIGRLEQMQEENDDLRRQIAAPPTLPPEELEALAQAREKALSIQCINNLKQFGLAWRVWALDNNDFSPPDTLSMSNELSTPKILVCPADTNRSAAKSWQSFTTANLSYDYLTPSVPNADAEPTRVLSRCPIHGHVGLCDGSVQGSVGKNHPDWLVQRDGKLYMETTPQAVGQTPTFNR